MNEATRPARPTDAPEISPFPMAVVAPLAVFVAALLVAYGFEIFSFNLSIDEEATAYFSRAERAEGSVIEGRWAMAGLALLIPNPVAPVVSTALGVGLAGATWWLLSRRFFGLSPWRAAAVASVAGTFPVLAFTFSFSSIAWVVGIGHVLVLGFAQGITSSRWRWRIAAVLSAAAAIAVYDTFLLVVAIVALVLVVLTPTIRAAGLLVGATVLSLVASRVIGLVVSVISGNPLGTYTSQFLDLAGFVREPRARLQSAFDDVIGTFTLSPDRFGLTSPWLAIAVGLLLIAAIVAVIRTPGTRSERIIRAAALLAILAVPFMIEALAFVVVFRSMIYLPILVIALGVIASTYSWRLPVVARRPLLAGVAALAVLAVLGSATVSNRLFATAATSYAMDLQLAFQIGQEKDRLLDGDQYAELPIVVNGLHDFSDGVFTEQHETFGLSFFDLNEMRTRLFLAAHGIRVVEATASQEKKARREFDDMPEYPLDGWIAVEDGTLLLNFGDSAK